MLKSKFILPTVFTLLLLSLLAIFAPTASVEAMGKIAHSANQNPENQIQTEGVIQETAKQQSQAETTDSPRASPRPNPAMEAAISAPIHRL